MHICGHSHDSASHTHTHTNTYTDHTQESAAKTSLYFSVDDFVREAGGAGDDKVPLVPDRVVPEVLCQQLVHEGQFSLPQTVGLQQPQEMTVEET